MRQISFRGKSTASGEWVYGYYCCPNHLGIHWILIDGDINRPHSIVPETVGLWTGFLDKAGRMVYEGDLVIGNTNFEEYRDEEKWTVEEPAVVGWDENIGGFYPFTMNQRWRCDVENIQIIGSIHN